WLVFAILVVMGGASVASTISANVRDRRREVGTLMALGATPRLVQSMFLLKACLLGAVGSTAGSLAGYVLAMFLGAQWLQTTISPLPGLLLVVVIAGLFVTTLAAYFPAWRASCLDPCTCFQEV
ncbi:MAG TPA: FtsX-like permease family protein, partial [Pirellulaceae bacterium]